MFDSGNTNSFEINTGSELALIHNDLSVLENHHSYTTFRILRSKGSNVLCNVRKDTFQSLKKTIVGAIMATDMINHFSECRNLDNLECDQSAAGAAPFNIKIPADRQVVVNLIIHSADLSAQCFPTGVAKVWEVRAQRTETHTRSGEHMQDDAAERKDLQRGAVAVSSPCRASSFAFSLIFSLQERISLEFGMQAAKEKALGIEVAAFMQNLTNPLLRRQNQGQLQRRKTGEKDALECPQNISLTFRFVVFSSLC